MAIQIEILSVDSNSVSAAFYYEPNSYLPASEDQGRMPQGVRLSPQEIQDLKDGKIIEWAYSMSTNGRPMNAIKNKLESEYRKQEKEAQRQYSIAYSFSNSAWDGSSWTDANS